MENHAHENHSCCCVCHKVGGIVVALIGLDFLLGALNVLSQNAVNIVWPVLVIIIGLLKAFGQGKCKCCEK